MTRQETQQLAKQIEAELAKETTDKQTWELVNDFWKITDGFNSTFLSYCLDRIEQLEARMKRQHGWQR